MDSVPTVVWVLAAIAVSAIVATLIDLSRHDVRHMPKWAWALIIVLASFPVGAIVYFVVGRVPPGAETDPVSDGDPPAMAARRGSLHLAQAGEAWPRGLGVHAAAPVVATTGLSKVYGDTAALSDVYLAVPAARPTG